MTDYVEKVEEQTNDAGFNQVDLWGILVENSILVDLLRVVNCMIEVQENIFQGKADKNYYLIVLSVVENKSMKNKDEVQIQEKVRVKNIWAKRCIDFVKKNFVNS